MGVGKQGLVTVAGCQDLRENSYNKSENYMEYFSVNCFPNLLHKIKSFYSRYVIFSSYNHIDVSSTERDTTDQKVWNEDNDDDDK